jgi:germacradienol/geosmin synthase
LQVGLYVKGLQDWQAGGHEWHMRSSRYMNDAAEGGSAGAPLPGPLGLGMSAARILGSIAKTMPARLKRVSHPRFEQVGPTPIPDIAAPSELRLSPHLPVTRRRALEWCRHMGLFDGVWDERHFLAADLPLCAAGTDPDASLEELDLATGWLVWGTYADDYYATVFGTTHDRTAAKVCAERLNALLSDAPPAPMSALERGLADLWQRTAPGASAAERSDVRQGTRTVLDSWLWELDNKAVHRVPDPIDHIEMRRHAFGTDLTMALSRIGREPLPAEVLRSRPVKALEHAAIDWAGMLNDLYSYQAEIQFDGDVHNSVLVAQDFFDCDRDRGVAIVSNLMKARLDQFHHSADIEIPALADAMRLPPATRAALDRHVAGLLTWMTGVHHWHRTTRRYAEAEQERRRVARLGQLSPWGLRARGGFGGPAVAAAAGT